MQLWQQALVQERQQVQVQVQVQVQEAQPWERVESHHHSLDQLWQASNCCCDSTVQLNFSKDPMHFASCRWLVRL